MNKDAKSRPEFDQRLISRGVENLKEYGYPTVDADNIMTDEVFSKFFRNMLSDNLGQQAAADESINRLIAEIDAGDVPS